VAVSYQPVLTELKRLESRLNELAASIAFVCERMASMEQWKVDHVDGAHAHLRQRIENARRVQERQGDRLWKMALQIANLATLLAAVTKLAGAW